MNRGSFIVTYTGIKFYVTDPTPQEVDGRDIAHALSLMCRGNGHLYHFYSVAQHCLNCFYEAKSRGYSQRVQLAMLLHDASEAYISDITRPVKQYLPKYLEMEKRIQQCVFSRFGIGDLTADELALVCEVDDNMLCIEFNDNHIYKGFSQKSPMTSKLMLDYTDMAAVEKQYLSALSEVFYD